MVVRLAPTIAIRRPLSGHAMLGGFLPPSISGNILWFDPSQASSITQSSGQVSQLNDLSGNANNLTQSTNSAKPTVQSAAQNGLTTLRYTAANSQVMNFTSTIAGGAYSEFIIFKLVTKMVAMGGTGAQDAIFLGSDGNVLVVSNDTGYSASTPSLFTDTTAYHLIEATSDGTNADSLLFYDRVAVTLTAQGNLGLGTMNQFGDSGQFGFADFFVGEYIRYNRALNSSERLRVESYLHSKWATP